MSEQQHEAPPPVGPKKTPEEWAELKKIGKLAHGEEVSNRREEQMRAAILAGVTHHNRWPVGHECTEAEFDAGLKAFWEEPLR